MYIEETEFTNDEIEEVELARDLCDGMLVGDERIVCFEILSKLFKQQITIFENKEEVLKAYLQLIQYNKFWSEAEWYNNIYIESVTAKIRTLINM